MKIYQLVACLDEGISYSWMFRAESEWHVAAYIVDNYQDYPDVFRCLGLDEFSRYEEEKITPEILLNAIGESTIDGDSEHGFEFFEFQDSDIKSTNNSQLVPTSNYKKYLHILTGQQYFPYNNFVLFQDTNYDLLDKLVDFKENTYFYKDEIQKCFIDWLSKAQPINLEIKTKLEEIVKDSKYSTFDWIGFETIANYVVPLVNLAKINNHGYSAFYDRLLEGKLKDTYFKGRVDMCFATGYNSPHEIDFILHHNSYKGSASPRSALFTQMIVAMNNSNKNIMFGAFVNHGFWEMIVIEKNEKNVYNIDVYKSLSQQKLSDVEIIFQFISVFKKNEN